MSEHLVVNPANGEALKIERVFDIVLWVGIRRWDRTWLAPAHTRHAWLRHADHPNDPPRQVFILAWRRQSYRWSALIIYVIETAGSDPIVVQRWAAVEQLRPVRADPNGVFGLR